MEKMNCDIIQDLIPSYVDEICSEATKACVEEHVKTCSECQQILQLCKDNSFSGKEIEKQELDGLKKIRRMMNMQTIISCILLFMIMLFGIWTFLLNINVMENKALSVGLSVGVVGILLVSATSKISRKPGKKQYILGLISLFGDIYITWLVYYCVEKAVSGNPLLGMEPVELGPFLEKQIIAVFILQIVFLLYHLFCMAKREMNCGSLVCVDIMGIFLMLANDTALKRMDTYKGFISAYTQMTVTIYGIVVVGVIAGIVIRKIFINRK